MTKLNKKSLITVAIITLAVLATIFIMIVSTRSDPKKEIDSMQGVALKQFEDKQLGVEFSLPETYRRRKDTPPLPTQENALPAKNFEQLNPQGLLTVRYESGLATQANISKRTMLEHIQAEIMQFFPVKYGQYKSISLKKTMVNNHESIEHIFSYKTQDGKPVKAKLVAVPYDNDSAYYLILQSHESVFGQIEPEINVIKRTLQINGPGG